MSKDFANYIYIKYWVRRDRKGLKLGVLKEEE
jgi:hypothetical protein